MQRYIITFSYDGSNYNGYQKQPKVKTIQEEIEKVLEKITKEKVNITAAGRTDAKVHALNQVAHFDLKKTMNENELQKALNSLLPKDIYIKQIGKVSNDFHARFSVIKKEYVYKINLGDYNPLEKNYIYQYNKELNIKNMKKASKYFVGKKDFTSFTSLDKEEKDKDCIRTIYKIKIENKKNILTITFVGDGFLRYMVRNIVGALIEVGENKKQQKDIQTILDKKDRTKAGKTASAEGLSLAKVFYK